MITLMPITHKSNVVDDESCVYIMLVSGLKKAAKKRLAMRYPCYATLCYAIR
jgi:hypothetical protein